MLHKWDLYEIVRHEKIHYVCFHHNLLTTIHFQEHRLPLVVPQHTDFLLFSDRTGHHHIILTILSIIYSPYLYNFTTYIHIFTLRWCIAPWSLHWQVTTVKSWSWRKSWLFKQPMKWWEKRTFRQRKGCSNNNTGKPTSTWRNASAPFPVCLSIWVTDSQMFAYISTM